MVLVMSILLFVLVTCTLYLFGVKFWANPKSMVARAMGEGPSIQNRGFTPAWRFTNCLPKLGTWSQPPRRILPRSRNDSIAPGSVPQVHARRFTASELYP